MGAKHEVLILGPGKNFHPKLREALSTEGFVTHTIFDIVEAESTLKGLNCPILLVDCGEEEKTAVTTVRAVIQNKKLHDYPLILIGYQVDAFEKSLDKYFELATTISTPYKPNDVLEALKYISKVYDRFFRQAEPEPVAKKPARTVEAITALQSLRRAIASETKNLPNQLFRQLESQALIGGSLGGAEYTEAVNEEFLSKLGYLPENQKIRSVVGTVCADAGKWGRNHLYRTCFLATRIVSSLPIAPRQQENVKAAAFLFAWAFAGNHPEFLKKNYYRPQGQGIRKELCSRIKDSAMKVAIELGTPEIGEIVSTTAKIIGEEIALGDTEVIVVASAIASASLIDRICFSTGFWNSRAAYHLLRRCKSDPYPEMHPLVWGACIKFLSESISANTRAYLLPKKIRENEELLQRSKAVEAGENEQNIPIASLAPGMRLSRPLLAFDGKEILSSDIKLDEDLIWRIWQLAALRPLNSPTVFSSEH